MKHLRTRARRRTAAAKLLSPADRAWRAADILAVAAALGGGWWVYANHVPSVSISADALPLRAEEGGAYARLVAAGKSVVKGEEIGFAIGDARGQTERFGHAFTAAEKEQMVDDNAAPLAELRAVLGSGAPVLPPAPAAWDYRADEYAKLRGMARLLRLEAMTRADRGEWGAAATSQLDAMRLGVALQGHSHLIPTLVGMACEAIGRRPLWGMAEHLSADEARAAVRTLEGVNDARPASAAGTFTQEKWATERAVVAEFRAHSLPQFGVSLAEAGREESGRPLPAGERFAAGAVSLTQPKGAVLAEYGRYMDDWAAYAALPHRPGGTAAPRELRGVLARQLTPALSMSLHKWRDSQAQTALLTVWLALRAYAADHNGAAPATLDELVAAGYLVHVPTDPFAPAAGTPLRYRRADTGRSILYSVGPDSVDNGGTPLDNRSTDGTYRPWSNSDSKGDIVAGVNLHSGPT